MTDDDRRLAQRLRAYESRVPDAPEPSVTLGGRPPWGLFAAIGAAAVLAVAILANNLANQNVGQTDPTATASPSGPVTPEDSPEPSVTPSVSPEPTPSAAESPVETPAAGISGASWSVEPSATLDGEIFRVTAEGGRFYALGRTDEGAAVWSSADGDSWQRVDLSDPADRGEGSVYVGELATSAGGELVAIGSTGLNDALRVVVWTSADLGTTWTEADTGGFGAAAYNVHDVTNGPNGLVAFSHQFGAGTGSSWRSGDAGRTWTEHRPPGDGIGLGVTVGTGRGYLIGGQVGADTNAPSPRIWYSNDAMTWTQATLEGSGGRGQVEQLAIDAAGRWVATGVLDGRVVVWRSTDRGLSWAVAADLGTADSGQAGYLLAGAPGGFIAFSATDPARTWTSPDGSTWSEGEPTTFDPSDESHIGWARGLARIGDTLVVGGGRSDANGSDLGTFTWFGTIQR